MIIKNKKYCVDVMSATDGIISVSVIIIILLLLIGGLIYHYKQSDMKNFPSSYSITIFVSIFILFGMFVLLYYFIEEDKKERFYEKSVIYNYCPHKLKEFCECSELPQKSCYLYSTKLRM